MRRHGGRNFKLTQQKRMLQIRIRYVSEPACCILFFFAVLFVFLCFFRFSIFCLFRMVDLQTDLSDPVFVHLLYF